MNVESDVSVCLKLSLVPDQPPGGVPARDADRWIRWFIGFAVIGVVVNLLSGFVVEQKWAWLPSAVFVAAPSCIAAGRATLLVFPTTRGERLETDGRTELLKVLERDEAATRHPLQPGGL
jgi:hypothetical protein